VFYLLHGWGEDETAWYNQGRLDFIMDNLIADKKAKPMIMLTCSVPTISGCRAMASTALPDVMPCPMPVPRAPSPMASPAPRTVMA